MIDRRQVKLKKKQFYRCRYMMSFTRRSSPIILNLITFSLLALANSARASMAQMADVIAIKEGADLDLECPIVTVQNEDMIISWTCDNEPANIRSSRIHVTESGKLRIRSAKVGDACNYRCEAADGFGTLSVIIKVIIVDKKLMDHLARHNQTFTTAQDRLFQQKISQKSVIKEAIEDEVGPLLGIGLNGINKKFDEHHHHNQLQQKYQQSDLEIQVEPVDINVKKNRTFSLECRVKHAPHLKAPQIIWLKEFIGRKPESLTEAREENLVMIDNVYYHSLNWPRSDTYTQKSFCVNSALLVRRSNFLHSGRYICFAGYPPTSIMSSNLSLISESTILAVGQNRPLKYKMALVMVIVDDAEGETNHKLALESTNSQKLDSEYGPKNLLTSVFSSNSWSRNLTAILIFVCGLLYVIKLIYIRYKLNVNHHKSDHAREPAAPSIENPPEQQLAINQLHQTLNDNNYYYRHHQRQQQSNSTSAQRSDFTTIITTSTDSHQDCSHIVFSAQKQLEGSFKRANDDDHLYSEIGERDKMTTNSEQNYKIPNTNKVQN